MMKSKSVRISIMLLLFGMMSSVNAAAFKIGDPGGYFDLGTGWVGQGDSEYGSTLEIKWSVYADFASKVFSLSNAGDTASLKFGEASFGKENFISGNSTFNEIDNLGITAYVDLVSPEVLGFSSIGVVGATTGYTCDLGSKNCFISKLEDTVVTDVKVVFEEVEVGFGVDGLLRLQLSEVIFNDDNKDVDVIAQFTLVNPDTGVASAPGCCGVPVSAVPVPPALLLMGSGLFGIASLARRRKVKV